MTQHDVHARLTHMRDAAGAILGFTSGKTYEDYEHDEMLRAAVERKFMIIGEALREALRLEPGLSTRFTATRRIIDFRNVLVHDYAIIYDDAVWRVIVTDLPLLLSEVGDALKDYPAGENPA